MHVAPRFYDQLELLSNHEVEFIVVGGVAAVLHGSPVMTTDVDVVYRVTEANVARLTAALQKINAKYRDPAGRHIEPDEERLRRYRINLLVTDYGALDVLQYIGDRLDYEALRPRAPYFALDPLRFRLLDLSVVIEAKEFANRPKDRATLPILRATLRERDRIDDP